MLKVLIIDIETDSLDVNIANIKFIGIHDGYTSRVLEYSEETKREIKALIKKYDRILTYNGTRYDLPILQRYGITLDYWQHVDLYQIMKKRATLIFAKGFDSLSLKNVMKKLYPESEMQKGEIDYNLFKKNEFTVEERNLIIEYTKRDLDLTWKLWLYLLDKFQPLADFITKEDAEKLKHVTISTASYAYKAICHLAGIEELWGDCSVDADEYEGAFCLLPIKEKAFNCIYLDFASLYPNIYVHNNLFSSNCQCCIKEEKWHGSDKWKVNGYYCKKQQGKIEQQIKELFLKRKEFKKNKDSREQAIKIILNSIYGASSRPGFIQLYSQFTASDCTSLGQQIIKYAISKFTDYGFNVLMSDTDSIVVELGNKSKEECLKLAKGVSEEISKSFPFPWEEFNLKFEDEVKYIQFFKNDKGELKKKNYVYINNEDKIIVKGLDIIQRDCSLISKDIFNNQLKNKIVQKLNCKFPRKYIEQLVYDQIKNDYSLLLKKFTIRDFYKTDTSIYSDILTTYGTGEISLVKNYKIGAGKNIKYCSLEEAKQLNFRDLDLSDVWAELEPFVIPEQQTLFC